ncbi:MAG: leucine-rich repeat protein [Lachnospiraceae bacterium]|nr:leucine-rich repeat protein [Lachnospiraceae bacterium]
MEGGTNGLQISGILIEWDAVDGAASYYISRKSSDEDNYSTVAYVNDASTVSYFHVIYVYNGVTYTYRVQAQDENGNDLGEYEEGTITYVSPAVVSTPTIGTGGVTVSWTWGYTIDDSTYFNIFRKTDSTDWELIGTSTGYDYLDSEISVSVGDTYYYSVQVCCSYGTSAMSIAMGLDDTGLVLGDISVAKYMEYEIDGEEYEGYIEEYGALAIGDQVCFSIEVTTYVGVVLEFDETEWSSSNEEAIAFGTVSVAGPTVSEEDESRQVYYLTATAELLAGGNCTISFSMRGETSTSAEIIIASTYNCGDDLIWSLDTDGTMTISGTGEMWDYNLDTDEDGNLLNAPPWEEYYEKVSSIVIEDGVTSIGTYAFYCFAKVRFLTIGSGLQSVGAYGIDVSSDQYGTKIYFTGASPDIDKAAFGIENNVIDAYYIPSMDAIIWADTVSATYENALVSWISSEDLSGNLSASDVFPFNNSDTYFGDSEEGYYLSTSDCEKLMSNLNIIQKRAIKWYSTSGTNVYHYNLDGNGYLIRSYEEWGGSCSGMVHLIALGLNGCFSSSTFNSGASTYSDIDNGLAPVSKRTESIINFYQLQQYLPQYDDLKSSFMKKNQYAQLTILDDELEKTSSSTASGSAGAVMISFQLKNTDDSGQIKKEGHVIMGFAVEKGTFHVEINGQTYTFDHRVLTYDPSKCLDMFENKANWYFQQYSLYYYIGGGSSEARWAIPGYDIISTTNDIDIYSENDTANFKLVTSSLSVINAIDYSTGALNLTTEVKNAYLSAQSTSSFTVTTSENIAYVIKDGQIDGIGTVSDDIVVYVGDTDGGTTAYGSELTVSLSGIDKAYTLATDSSDSFSMLYENVALDAYCSSGGSSICFDPAGKVTLDADNVGECAVAITANEGYSSLEYPTIIVSGDNVSSLSAELTDEGDILIEGDNMSDVTISGDMLDGEDVDQVDISSDQDSVLISEDDNGNLTIYEDTDNDGLYDEVIAKMNGDISTCTVTLSSNNFTYNGIAQTPSVTVRSEDGTALAEETDYKVSYSDNINAGTASVIITGIGSYWGTVTKNFTISKANQTVSVSVAPTAIKVGETAKVTASGEGTLSYSSSDPSVASVDSSTGTVTGKKAGTVTITVTAAGTENYNSSSSEVAITVAAADSGGAGTGDSTSTGGDTTSDNTSTGSDATDDGTSTGDGTTGDDTSTSGDTTDGSSSSDNDMIVSDSSTDGGSSSGSDSSSGTMTEDRGAETIGSSYSDGSATYTVTSSDSSGRNVTITAVNTTASSTSTSVTIPESVEINGSGYTVTAIADNAFAGNTTLTTVSIGKNVTSIGANAFKNCTSLKTVKGCASVKIIGASAFQGCTALVTVKGMTNVTAVGSKAFYKCVKLTTIGSKSAVATLANVVTIGKSAFYGCKALKKVNLTSKTLASIGTSAFQGCTALKSFTAVSTKLKSIGKKAFYGDKKLTTVTLKTRKLTKSSVKANAFKGIKSSCTFRIPSSKVSAYKIIFRAKGAGSGIKVKKL